VSPAGLYPPYFSAVGGGVSSIYATPPWQTLAVTGLNVLESYSLPGQTGVSPRAYRMYRWRRRRTTMAIFFALPRRPRSRLPTHGGSDDAEYFPE